MDSPSLSELPGRFWRQFRTQQPGSVQAVAAAIALVLVADLVGLGATGSSTRGKSGQTVQASPTRPGQAGGQAGGTAGSVAATTSNERPSVGGGGAGPGAGGPGTGVSGGPASANGPLRNLGHGVAASSIKVVFPWPNLGPLGQAVGLYGTSEDDTLSVNAAVDAINDAGGINGRKIDSEIVGFNPLDDNDMRAKCIQWTQDQQVFAVVDADAWHDDHQLCVTQEHHTPLISSWTTVTDWTNRGNPNLWWTGPDDAVVLDNLVAWASGQSYLTPKTKFGVVAADREGDKLAAGYLNKDLSNIGLAPADTGSMHFDLADAATAQAQARDIVTRFNIEGIHALIPLLPYTDFVYLVEAAKEQSYFPRWLLSDYEFEDEVALGLINPRFGGPYASELNNTVNPTFYDLGPYDDPRAYPPGSFGYQCWKNFVKYSGAAWAQQNKGWSGYIEATGTAMTWCQNIDLFAAAARAVPPNQLTQSAFDQAMTGISHFADQLTPDLAYGIARRAGPHEFRVVEEHVNSDGQCPLLSDGGKRRACWIVLRDWLEALKT